MALNVILTFSESTIGDGLRVRRYELRDGLNDFFELTVELLSRDSAIAECDVVGQPVVVDLTDEPIVKQVRGIVWEMRQATAVPGGDSRYILTIAPPLRLTTQRLDHRIFQDKNVPEMVDEVLGGYSGRIGAPVKVGTDGLDKWEYGVQYRETDWQFLRRMLADAGVSACFDHASGSCWKLINDTADLTPDGSGPIQFLDQSLLKPVDESTPYILTMASQRMIRTSRVTERDYCYEKAGAPQPEGTYASKPEDVVRNEGELERYLFEVDYFSDNAAGNDHTHMRLQSCRTGNRLVVCTTNFTMAPGSVMTVEGHPNLDGDYLVVRAHAVVEDGGERRHELVVMSSEHSYLPELLEEPRIHGIQTAVVVGAEGAEIDVDQLGRVLLAFRWDCRDPTSGAPTRRVRVSQGWSGTDRGFVTLPRVGDEVLVAYLDGDPCNPIVVGRVHNATSTSPLNLPADAAISLWRSKSTPGGNGYNEILMDDKAGAERLAMHAQRDFKQVVERDAETVIGRHEIRTVKGNRSVAVVGNQKDKVQGDKEIDVTGALDLHGKTVSIISDERMDLYAGAHLQVSCASDRDDDTTSNHKVEADALFLKGRSGVQVVGPKIHVFGGEEIHLQVGASSIHITAGGIEIHGPVVDVKGAPIKLNS